MNKKVFLASNWFVKSIDSELENTNNIIKDRSNDLNSLFDQSQNHIEEQNQKIESELNRFFVPGWKGESLISKDIKEFIKILNKFHKDARDNFSSQEKLSRRIKMSIYDEFISFAEYKSFNCTDLDHFTSFWNELNNPNSKYKKEINIFLDIFSFRIAVIYLLKVRFIITLLEQTDTKFDLKNIYYPNSFLQRMFLSGSSTELKSKAFEQNVFSWYRPSEQLKNTLIKFKEISTKLKITEIIKTISTQSEKILEEEIDYSHSLSHKNFGLFLNTLLINFPIWKSSLQKKYSFMQEQLTHDNMEIISCKFDGDYLESMGLSHWLAQDANKNLKWDSMLCPDFKQNNFETGHYLKLLNEIQFLTFLAQIANLQGKEPKKFVCNIANSHLYNRKNSNEIQKSLLLNDNSVTYSTYDRIILNIAEFPKNNPQHFLFNKILSQKETLKDNGLLYILTTKRLFVPSQKAKVENLLKEFKVEGIFNFEDVKGKGKLGSYIYIFSKKKEVFIPFEEDKKQPCLNFRYSANLTSFHNFHNITDLTSDFFNLHKGDLPPLFHKNIGDFRLEFNQDAIVGGQLIHSSSKDSKKITHPLFFKKLMSLCNSLEYFFDLQNIEFNQDEYGFEEESSFFNFSGNFQRDKSPYTIVVDQRIKDDIKIEIIDTKDLESISYDYGHALCSYYYAYPKWGYLNIKAIKEFFNSAIGKQVINLTFSNEVRKVKGNLSKLLIPKLFTNNTHMPEHIEAGLQLLNSNRDQLLAIHPSTLTQNFNEIQNLLPTIVKSYPNNILSMICNFKSVVNNAIEVLGGSRKSNSINFSNPLLKTPLVLSKTYPIYPDNKEVYVEFNNEALNQIHSPLTKVKKKSITKDGFTTHSLDLFTQDQKVVTLYSEEEMILFLEFLGSELKNIPISKVLQGVSVPALNDLKSILDSYQSISRSLEQISAQMPELYDRLMNTILMVEN